MDDLSMPDDVSARGENKDSTKTNLQCHGNVCPSLIPRPSPITKVRENLHISQRPGDKAIPIQFVLCFACQLSRRNRQQTAGDVTV